MHVDHAVSVLHMAVSVSGTRTLWIVEDGQKVEIQQNEGSIYVTSPAGITHGVTYPEYKAKETKCVRAIQLRTHIDNSRAFHALDMHREEALMAVAHALSSCTLRRLLLLQRAHSIRIAEHRGISRGASECAKVRFDSNRLLMSA